jgi:hypothetical protein
MSESLRHNCVYVLRSIIPGMPIRERDGKEKEREAESAFVRSMFDNACAPVVQRERQ